MVTPLTVGAVFPMRIEPLTGVPTPPMPSSGVTVHVTVSPPAKAVSLVSWVPLPRLVPAWLVQTIVELSPLPSGSVRV